MKSNLTLTLTDMAHGGFAIGRNKQKQVIFVPGGIPGEEVEIQLSPKKKKVQYGQIQKIIKPSSARIPAPHPNIGPHGGFSYQHILYPVQLKHKQAVVADQLRRIGGIQKINIPQIIESPKQWAYDYDVTLSPTQEGTFGFWSGGEGKVIESEGYPSLTESLQALLENFDFDLSDLRKLTVRAGTEDDILIAFEVQDMEPPEILVDIPVSAALVLPDRTAANLIGETHVVREVNGKLFKLPAGCRFPGNLSILPAIIEQLQKELKKAGQEKCLVLNDDIGLYTAFISPELKEIIAVEPNGDGIDAASINLEETENVSLYQGYPEEVLPILPEEWGGTLILNDPFRGLNPELLEGILHIAPKELIYLSSDLATFARDTKILKQNRFWLSSVTPFDLFPQTFHVYMMARFKLK